MKFKVGDKVKKINCDNEDVYGVVFKVGQTGIVMDVKIKYNVEFCDVKLSNGCVMSCVANNLELVEAGFTKSDLKDGMVVEYTDGQRRMVLGDYIISDSISKKLERYNENLEAYRYPTQTINKVYKTKALYFSTIFDNENLTLIWERPEEPVKKMTVAEIEKELGYKVEIVSEN